VTASALRQGSQEWLAARRELITSTDIPVILGLSPYKSEATLAREKSGVIAPSEASLQMLIGRAVEPVIGVEYERITGFALTRYAGIVRHPQIAWAAASPDWRRKRARYLVEGKNSQSRRWQGDEAPQDVEAQVRWAMGCTGFPVADVAALLHNSELRIFTVEHDQATFDNLVAIASDFRRRLAAGGPFAEDAASLKAAYPADNGAEMVADEELADAIHELLRARAQRADIEAACDRLETLVKSRMGEFARLAGPDFAVTWKRTRDVESTDWKSLADGVLRQLPDEQRQALLGIHTTVRQGCRPFRITVEKGVEA